MNNFLPGQRWISNTESELGLGLILEVDFNRVSVLFLATGDKRIYAKDNAPLTRALFSINDVIESTENIKISVKEILDNKGLITYKGVNETGAEVILDEIDLNHHIQFNKPQDRLFTGQLDPSAWFLLRYETWRRQQLHQKSTVKGLQGARASLIAHQLYIAHEAANRFEPRIMLADEVGLGKTIEAGLTLQHRLINGLSQRLLIIVPESLLHQWLVEMLRRFNLTFSIFDEDRCLATIEENPFTTEQFVLCSQSFFSNNPLRQQQVLEAGWDMLVVDEAHHLEWNEKNPSADYLFIEQLSNAIPGLILLTATPEQLGKKSHFARLRLLDPDRFYHFDQFLAEEAQFEPIAHAAKLLISGKNVSDKEKITLKELLKQENVDSLLSDLNNKNKSDIAREELINLLLDHHGTGRILFRNSRQTVQGFPDRESYGYPLKGDSDKASNMENNLYFLWLLQKLSELQESGEKALLICHQAETVIQLEQTLKNRKGIATAVFHEGMSIIERDRAAAYFSDDESTVPLLICSEIGSEGRNFQFVHHLILFDLPTNPDLLQQRIGRLDRIGQKNVIQIHIPYLLNSPQHVLYRWYEEGFNAFQHNCSAAAQVASELNEELVGLLEEPHYEAIDIFISKTQQLNQAIELEMLNGRDQLLELNSCRQEQAQDLIEQLRTIDNDNSLWPYMESLFDCYGVDSEYHSKDCYILKPSENLRISYFPMVPEDGITVTVDRNIALVREDMLFISQEHPMVITAMDLVLSSETGNSTISVIKHPDLKTGLFLLELLFIVECSAPSELKIGRFLPHTPIRILIDQNNHNLSEIIDHRSLIETGDKFDKDQIVSFLSSQREHITNMIKTAEKTAIGTMRELVNDGNSQMMETISSEIKRLVRLKKINPSIKEEEIKQLKETVFLSKNNIKQSQLRLDAIRFIITN
ncbi:MAG: RNA polymerase-associated protein RapA [Methylococcaceae bacterium]|nr:RNA polymerase-associated protein RapA [Methylococcaceae bacterium]